MSEVIDATPSGTRAARAERTRAAWAPILLAALALAGCAAGLPEGLHVEPQEAPTEVLRATPAPGWVYHGRSAAEVDALLLANGARLVSLQVESASPLTFTVAMVPNTGSQHRASWWFYGQTAPQIEALTSALGARITRLQPYVVGGTTCFAAILVENAGADRKRWWWHGELSWAQVLDMLEQNGARPVDLRQYAVDGERRFAVVMESNTDADATGWWLYGDVPPGQISSLVERHDALIVAMEPSVPAGAAFHVILHANPGVAWWYHTDVGAEALAAAAAQASAPLVDVRSYVADGGSRKFVAVAADDSDPETARIRRILRKAGGRSGLYLKQVGAGAVEAAAEQGGFDPASTIKTLVAVRVLRAVEASQLTLDTPIWYHPDPRDGRSCPDGSTAGQASSVRALLRAMLIESDNWATRALVDTTAVGGFPGVQAAAWSAGMVSTILHAYPGCPNHNATTLRDLGRLYEGIADLSLLASESRDLLYASLPGGGGDSSGALARARAIAEEEGVALGLTAAQRDAFQANLRLRYKAGSGTSPESLEVRAIAGLVEIPRCSAAVRGAHAADTLAWGLYIHAAPRVVIGGTGSAPRTQSDQTFEEAQVEPLRRAIRTRLAGWAACAG